MSYVVFIRTDWFAPWEENFAFGDRNSATDWAVNHAGVQYGQDNVKIEEVLAND